MLIAIKNQLHKFRRIDFFLILQNQNLLLKSTIKIGCQILDAEIRNRHRKKKKLLQQVKNNTDSLTNKIGLITKIVLY